MKRKFILAPVLLLAGSLAFAGIKPERLRCEYINNPQVVDIQNPRLSWINVADQGERGQGKAFIRRGRSMEQR